MDKRYGSFLYSLKAAQTLIEVSHKNNTYITYIGFGRCERVSHAERLLYRGLRGRQFLHSVVD